MQFINFFALSTDLEFDIINISFNFRKKTNNSRMWNALYCKKKLLRNVCLKIWLELSIELHLELKIEPHLLADVFFGM